MQLEARRAATQRDSDRYWAARTHSQAPQGHMLGRLRGALGLGPRDHLAAAAAKMEKMEAAETAAKSATAAAQPPPLVADASSKSVGSSKAATPAPSRAHTASIALQAQSSTGNEAPLPVVELRTPRPSQGPANAGSRAAAAPTWATRDSGSQPKPGMFHKWFAQG